MKILDLTAGNRAIWFNRAHPLCTYLDVRPEVEPDIVCDTKSIPSTVGDGFDLIVYDPPHMCCGPNSNMAKSYGHWSTGQILENIKGSGAEAWRVSKENALMALKWNTHDIRLQRVLDLLPNWEPLFGHQLRNMGGITKSKRVSQTYWVMLRRLP
jgi:hypothetical protein